MPKSIEHDPLLTIDQTAELLQMSPFTIRRMVSRGELPAFRVGGTRSIRIKSSNVQRLLRPVTKVANLLGGDDGAA